MDPHRDHARDRVALRRTATFPAQSTALHGVLAPSLLLSPLLLGFFWGNLASAIPVLAAVAGGLFGLLVGAIDVPGRAAAALADREDLLALMVMSILSGAVLGAMWGGATGATLGAVFYAYSNGIRTFRPEDLAGFMLAASIFGAFAATPGVTMFSFARALIVRLTGPWWLSNLAGIAATIGAVTSLVLVYSLLGFMVVMVEAIW